MAKKPQARLPFEFSVAHGGDSVEFSRFVSKDKVTVDVIEVQPGRFDACPICLTPDPQEKEHLPPQSVGGAVMTWTCQRCNNDFGTAEDELRRYIELEVEVRARSADGHVRGNRRATVALRSTTGRPTAAFVRSAAPGFDEILAAGSSHLLIESLDIELVRAAALKQAYLAACLVLHEVPIAESVARARAVLLAARDRDRSALTRGLADVDIPLPGWVATDGAAPVLLLEPSDRVPSLTFVLGGRFAVPWPFADLQLAIDCEDRTGRRSEAFGETGKDPARPG